MLAHQDMCVDADVTVLPTVKAGAPTTECLGGPCLEACGSDGARPGRDGDEQRCGPRRGCRFSVRQRICVTVPLFFGATAEATLAHVSCEQPGPGPCDQDR